MFDDKSVNWIACPSCLKEFMSLEKFRYRQGDADHFLELCARCGLNLTGIDYIAKQFPLADAKIDRTDNSVVVSVPGRSFMLTVPQIYTIEVNDTFTPGLRTRHSGALYAWFWILKRQRDPDIIPLPVTKKTGDRTLLHEVLRGKDAAGTPDEA